RATCEQRIQKKSALRSCSEVWVSPILNRRWQDRSGQNSLSSSRPPAPMKHRSSSCATPMINCSIASCEPCNRAARLLSLWKVRKQHCWMCWRDTRRPTTIDSLLSTRLGISRARLAARAELSHAVLPAGAFDSDRRHDAFLHLENLHRLCRPKVLAMARSAGRVANRTRRAQLFHDRILESGERDSPRTSSGHARERADDAYQRADCDRCEFGVGFCAGDFLFIALPFLRLVVL